MHIPSNAVRCLVFIPNGEPMVGGTQPLSKKSEKQIKRTAPAIVGEVKELTSVFGHPSVICSQDPAAITTAGLTGVYHKFSTSQVLNNGASHNQNRAKARELIFSTTKDKNLTVVYADPKILNKAFGCRNSVSKIPVKMGTIAVLFLNGKDKIVGSVKMDTLPVAA